MCIFNRPELHLYIFDSPLDQGWEFLQKADDFADKLAITAEHSDFSACTGMKEWLTLKEFTKDLRAAKEEFIRSPYIGEIDNYYGVRLLWFPVKDCLGYAFLTKTSNNGTTAIATKFRLDEWSKFFSESF